MFLLSAVALLALAYPLPATVAWHKRFSLMGRPEIRVASNYADVRVYASDKKDIEAVLYTDRTISTDAVTDRESGEHLDLNVNVPNQWEGGFSHGSAVLELKIPLGCDVDVHSGKGSILVKSAEGKLTLHTENGKTEHAPAHRSTKKSAKHPGRQAMPANLPRVEQVLSCTPDQRVCKRCGNETVVIGYEESSQLDVEPARYFVLVTKREKRACRSFEDLGVVSAPPPPRIIEKCLASDRIVIETIVGKYCNHTPLHRQSMILERDLRLKISRATLDGWVLTVGELLIPMVAAMRRELISGSYIRRMKPRFLGQFEGILQNDGYAAYDRNSP